ncbi:MAG: hypothetical protein NVS1B3_00380 [Candidatus Dormibacteraceae bacterium]
MPENGLSHRPADGFGPHTKVRDVLDAMGEKGTELLRKHGYDPGEGFVDVLSQYQTLEHAARTDRLRDLDGLIQELNSAS